MLSRISVSNTLRRASLESSYLLRAIVSARDLDRCYWGWATRRDVFLNVRRGPNQLDICRHRVGPEREVVHSRRHLLAQGEDESCVASLEQSRPANSSQRSSPERRRTGARTSHPTSELIRPSFSSSFLSLAWSFAFEFTLHQHSPARMYPPVHLGSGRSLSSQVWYG